MDDNYKVFFNEDELPKQGLCTVVMPFGEGSDGFCVEEMLIGYYSEGKYTEEQNMFTATEVLNPITNYVDTSKPVYVHEDVVPAYEFAMDYAKKFEDCNGNLDAIAERFDEEMGEMMSDSDEEEDD